MKPAGTHSDWSLRWLLVATALCAFFALTGCPKAGMAIRIWNRSGREIGAYWQDRHRTPIKDGHNAMIGRVTANPDATYSIGIEDWASLIAYDDIPASVFTDAATRPVPSGDGREFCLEFAPDQNLYALDGRTLRRLVPQPDGFPLHPAELK